MLAMTMGRTVCITDPVAAQARNERMLAARAAGSSSGGSIAMPKLGSGCLMAGCPEAGSYFPQFVADQENRLDDVLGPGAWLIAHAFPSGDWSRGGLQTASLKEVRLAPFNDSLQKWLAKRGADAVLVRPDRYVFGLGSVEALTRAWAGA